ncbi:hypothetical protein MATR_05270 [Marivirga tractuosa]|uniref:Uncharacterized protein n=1 Tax=Marivirga tractuosa (strain ATCC 23168 / DSM 4126 / NBRC 15989 / NCIMB 1408 / VKM B-1430 / H-43) TaxID=643867 RepID=E4TSN0_MARTH|nr:DUF4221 family protein [Marivirga tractuosa]ADR21840.1 hypothetical protein Ftrac_1852 [Marivirga tractuosa DSM 4126]BDD13702.1 hypothetical protein MATR_05270 [Marivirga tractuosa]
MKYISLILTIISAISFTCCNQKQENTDKASKISISIDSTIVDSNEEIIDTKYGLNTFGFDKEKDFIYKFNSNNRHGLEVIDMNKMELVGFIPFEVEGPNGTTNRITDVNYLENNSIALTIHQAILLFNMEGELLQKYVISEEDFAGDSIPKDFNMEPSGLFLPAEKLSFNLINKGFGELRGFSQLDLTTNSRSVFLLDEFKKLSDYHISLTIDGRMMMLRTYIYSNFQNDRYILSHDMENELFYYDLNSDSIIHKEYKSELSANKNEVYGKDVESREELGKIMSARNKSIRFKDIVFDQSRNQYYRFSSYSTTPDQEEDKWNIILTIFDKDLNQLFEIDNIPLEEVPETYFVKDGKIYIYKNMEDELGFLTLAFN